jgi:uncharacterized protein with ParB-like and HNH nuclease domain
MKVSHDDILTFLYTPGKYFIIPDFQRPYSWDTANIVAFVQDLESAVSSKKPHFFGNIVYISEGKNSTIIDGQQRATTVLLMLTALYHITTDKPSASKISSEEIKNQYLYNSHDYSENTNRIKLRTVTTDNTIFEQIFERSGFTENSKDSKLYLAYAYFYSYFREKSGLETYVSALEKFEVVTIVLDSSDDNPQRIFESINSTGKPLTDGDKIRNFALMLNDKDAREVVLNNYWGEIERQLTTIDKDYISDFFRCFLTSHLQKDVKINQVYPEFKKLFNSDIGDGQRDIEKIKRFYDYLLGFLKYYVFLKLNKIDPSCKGFANKGFRLNYLNIETPYPFLMRALNENASGRIDDKEMVRIFEIIETYLARRIICNIPTTGLNKLFATLHKEIENYLHEYPEERYSDVLIYILASKSGTPRLPREAEVRTAISTSPMYKQRRNYVYFILSSIDDQSKESTLLKRIANEDNQLSIEHIIPQTLSPKWKEDLGSDYELIIQKYLHTLPNLTLTAYNSEYSNRDFETKKHMENGFDESPLIINQFIKDFEKWNLAALESRAKWWEEQIDKLWSLPSSAFQPKEQQAVSFYDYSDFTGSKVNAVVILGETIKCTSWASVLENILKRFFFLYDNLYDFVTSDNFLHKYVTADEQALRNPKRIEGTSYFYESNTNTNLKVEIVVRLAEYLELNETDIKYVPSEV